MIDVVVIGAGPAGLMAAHQAAISGRSVVLVDAMPTIGRKLLMAGKSGLNLTKAEPLEDFFAQYPDADPDLIAALKAFCPEEVVAWANSLGQETFVGSSGRVFPKVMKASPLLRAWVSDLRSKGVDIRSGWKWQGGDTFKTPDGVRRLDSRAKVLAMGGASWSRLGSDGAWTKFLPDAEIAPFKPANMGFLVDWSTHMSKHFGQPVKAVELISGNISVRAEFVISAKGIEGGGIYAVSRPMREGLPLFVDLLPDLSTDDIRRRLRSTSTKHSLSNRLRKALKMDPTKLALFNEFGRPLPSDPTDLLKRLPISHSGPRPMDEAISTAGGVKFSGLDENLMMHKKPGWFVAGEMLDWEAPTGGYLLTACLATGRKAGIGAVDWLNAQDSRA